MTTLKKSREVLENEWYDAYENDQRLGQVLLRVLTDEGVGVDLLGIYEQRLKEKVAPIDALYTLVGSRKAYQILSNAVHAIPPERLLDVEVDVNETVELGKEPAADISLVDDEYGEHF